MAAPFAGGGGGSLPAVEKLVYSIAFEPLQEASVTSMTAWMTRTPSRDINHVYNMVLDTMVQQTKEYSSDGSGHAGSSKSSTLNRYMRKLFSQTKAANHAAAAADDATPAPASGAGARTTSPPPSDAGGVSGPSLVPSLLVAGSSAPAASSQPPPHGGSKRPLPTLTTAASSSLGQSADRSVASAAAGASSTAAAHRPGGGGAADGALAGSSARPMSIEVSLPTSITTTSGSGHDPREDAFPDVRLSSYAFRVSPEYEVSESSLVIGGGGGGGGTHHPSSSSPPASSGVRGEATPKPGTPGIPRAGSDNAARGLVRRASAGNVLLGGGGGASRGGGGPAGFSSRTLPLPRGATDADSPPCRLNVPHKLTLLVSNNSRQKVFVHLRPLQTFIAAGPSDAPSAHLTVEPAAMTLKKGATGEATLILRMLRPNVRVDTLVAVEVQDGLRLVAYVHAVTAPAVFGVAAAHVPTQRSCGYDGIPVPLAQLCTRLLRDGGDALRVEGIFRLQPPSEEVAAVRAQLDAGTFSGRTSSVSPLAAAHCIKVYLREMPVKLLAGIPTEALLGVSSPADSVAVVARFMPPPARTLLTWLAALLARVAAQEAVNRMNGRNIAVCVGPNLFESNEAVNPMEALMTSQKAVQLLAHIIAAQADAPAHETNDESPPPPQPPPGIRTTSLDQLAPERTCGASPTRALSAPPCATAPAQTPPVAVNTIAASTASQVAAIAAARAAAAAAAAGGGGGAAPPQHMPPPLPPRVPTPLEYESAPAPAALQSRSTATTSLRPSSANRVAGSGGDEVRTSPPLLTPAATPHSGRPLPPAPSSIASPTSTQASSSGVGGGAGGNGGGAGSVESFGISSTGGGGGGGSGGSSRRPLPQPRSASPNARPPAPSADATASPQLVGATGEVAGSSAPLPPVAEPRMQTTSSGRPLPKLPPTAA